MNQKGVQAEVFLFTLGVLLVGGAMLLSGMQNLPPITPLIPQDPNFVPALPTEPIPTFASCSAIKTAFEESASKGRQYGYGLDMVRSIGGIAPPMMAQSAMGEAESGSSPAPAYSKTNVQVEGVDEADIVKTDGTYIYTLSGNSLTISQGYPASDAKLLSKTKLEKDSTTSFSPQEMFIDGEYVLVFGQSYRQIVQEEPFVGTGGSGAPAPPGAIMPYPYRRSMSTTVLQLWNASNKQQPTLVKTAEFEGGYVSSRKINSQVFFVLTTYPQYWVLEKETQIQTEQIIPVYREKTGSLSDTDSFKPVARCGEIGYLPPVQARNFITIGSFAMNNPNSEIQKQTVVGSGENVYASQTNLYVVSTQLDYQEPTPIEPVNDAIRPFIEGKQFTMIHKFSLLNNQVSYLGSMKAPGHILNQFSMDEFENHFRIATTIGEVWNSETKSTNNIYIFDDARNRVGQLEDLAPGEKIYSVRFMGKKGYLVTFKKVDPLFVIDLADPFNPRVLGKLKIPGYSDYLHPFDETHIIGIGKEAIDAEQSLVEQRNLDFAWYQGLKIALFDVSDVEHPKEMYKVVIGDRGTDSEALHDHKAFLFDKEKQLLVIPVTLAEISPEQRAAWEENQNQIGMPPYGEFTFQGAFVYNLSLENGFQLKGRITHDESGEQAKKSGYYYGDYGTTVRRSLYIENVLYTISDSKIKLNQLSDLSEIKSIDLTGLALIGPTVTNPTGSGALIQECADPQYISDSAAFILEGTVNSVESKRENGNIYTFSDLTIENYIKGDPIPGNHLTIKTSGGTVGETTQAVEDQPILHSGTRVRIYLEKNNDTFSFVCANFGLECLTGEGCNTISAP